MPHDKKGTLQPYMLSDLIAFAKEILKTHGDMPLWVETTRVGYDSNETHSFPVGYPPDVEPGKLAARFWKTKKVFVISGSETG